MEQKIRALGSKAALDAETMMAAKKMGYPDSAIRALCRLQDDGYPHAARPPERAASFTEWSIPAAASLRPQTPYFYCHLRCTENEAKEFLSRSRTRSLLVVLGSGPIRIGQGIEFDYCSVHCVWALKQAGYDVVIINNNPETVSTDFDTADRLYFEPLTPEDVMNVH